MTSSENFTSGRTIAILASAICLSCIHSHSSWADWEQIPLVAEDAAPLYNDPVFTPTNLATAFHMTPTIYYGGEILHPGDFDFDLVLGTYGTDFSKAEKRIYLEEDTDWSFYTELGWRFGVAERIGPLRIPVEVYTQLPFYSSGDFESSLLDKGEAQRSNELDEDFSVGKWVLGTRLGLVSETDWRPSVVLGGSIGLPIDDSVASDGTDFDLRLTFEKNFRHGITGSIYTGMLFPGEGQEVLKDIGIDSETTVPYIGWLAQANVAQFCGQNDPGRTWVHFGGSWRDALYDFGSVGPDYAEEETKLTGGVTFDLGWWGRTLGRPLGMVGATHTLFGGPEEGETELVLRVRFPYRFGRGHS
jgi:hypothetical protein